MFCLRCLCLLVSGGIQHILYCVFALSSSSCGPCFVSFYGMQCIANAKMCNNYGRALCNDGSDPKTAKIRYM
jgi:hypothetical protein